MSNFQNKGISTLVGVVIILLVAVILGSGVYLWQQKNLPTSNPVSSQNQVASNSTSSTQGWQTYTNTQYGFEIKYPNLWFAKPLNEGITNRDILALASFSKEQNCQIFIDYLTQDTYQSELFYAKNLRDCEIRNLLADDVDVKGFICPYDAYFNYYFQKDNNYFSLNFYPGYSHQDIGTDKQLIFVDCQKYSEQMLSTFKFIDNLSDKNTNYNPPGLGFGEAFYNGLLSESCQNMKTQKDCETNDAVKIENGNAVSGKDGIVDCIWANNLCVPK